MHFFSESSNFFIGLDSWGEVSELLADSSLDALGDGDCLDQEVDDASHFGFFHSTSGHRWRTNADATRIDCRSVSND